MCAVRAPMFERVSVNADYRFLWAKWQVKHKVIFIESNKIECVGKSLRYKWSRLKYMFILTIDACEHVIEVQKYIEKKYVWFFFCGCV